MSTGTPASAPPAMAAAAAAARRSSRRLVPLQVERGASHVSFSSAGSAPHSPSSVARQHHGGGEAGDGHAPPPLIRRTSTRRRLVSKRAIQDRDDFNILLFASFWLCFNASFVNVVTMSSYLSLTTSHVTGLVAKTAIAIADEDWHYLYLPSTTFLCFLLGATVGGATISYDTFYLGRSYGRSLLFIAFLQALALFIDKVHAPKSTAYHQYVYMCSVACGLQNSLTSKYSGNTIRTTHLTGATTDLGIALGHLLRGKWADLWKVKLHSTAILGFLAGGIAGRLGYKRFQETALVFNVTILTLLGVGHMAYLSYHEHLSLWTVIKAKKDVKVHHHHSARLHHLYGGGGQPGSRPHLQHMPRSRSAQELSRLGSNIRVRRVLALSRIDSSGGAGTGAGAGSPRQSVSLRRADSGMSVQTSLSQGMLPLSSKQPSWLGARRGSGASAGHGASTLSPAHRANAAAVAAAAPSSLAVEVTPAATTASAAAAAVPPAMARLASASSQASQASQASQVSGISLGSVGPSASLRASPRAASVRQFLTPAESERLIQVEVGEEDEDEDDDISRPGDEDVYSLSDVAGEPTDDDEEEGGGEGGGVELLVDEVGDLIDYAPTDDEEEEEEGEGEGEGGRQEQEQEQEQEQQFYEARDGREGGGEGHVAVEMREASGSPAAGNPPEGNVTTTTAAVAAPPDSYIW